MKEFGGQATEGVRLTGGLNKNEWIWGGREGQVLFGDEQGGAGQAREKGVPHWEISYKLDRSGLSETSKRFISQKYILS